MWLSGSLITVSEFSTLYTDFIYRTKFGITQPRFGIVIAALNKWWKCGYNGPDYWKSRLANRTATFAGKCDEGADLYHSCAPWISPGPIRAPPLSLSLNIRNIVRNINGKEQHPVLVPRARNYNAAPPIAAKEEHLFPRYTYICCAWE